MASSQNSVYRILAGCLAISAGGLAAWYHFVQEPLVEEVERARASALSAQVASPTEPEVVAPIVVQADHSEEIAENCAELREQLQDLPSSHDVNGTRFAVEELLRNARLDTASIEDDAVTTEGAITTHSLTLKVAGQARAIHRLLENLAQYRKAGATIAVDLRSPEVPADESSSDRRRRERKGPQLYGTIALQAVYVEEANPLLAANCVTP